MCLLGKKIDISRVLCCSDTPAYVFGVGALAKFDGIMASCSDRGIGPFWS